MRSTGSVAGHVYGDYFRAGGNWCVILTILMLCILAQLFASGCDIFISIWVNLEEANVSMFCIVSISDV